MAKILGSDEARGLTIVADFQTHGTGRKGRRWIAPPGSALLFTTALPELLPRGHLWTVPFWIALVVRKALARYSIAVDLQWPNDLLLDGRKAGGILCISRITGENAWTACGVGINTLRTQGESEELLSDAAFLSDVRAINRDVLLAAILEEADRMYADLQSPQTIALQWEKAARIPGTRYRIVRDGGAKILEGVAIALGPEGELVVDAKGVQHAVAIADARVLRD